MNHCDLSCPDLAKEIVLKGNFSEAQMDGDMIVRHNFMMETDCGLLPVEAFMTLYHDDVPSWTSSPEHHVGQSPLRSVKTCKFSCPRGVQIGAFMGQLPRTGKRQPIFFTHGRILLGASALGRARPSTRPSRTCGTFCQPSIVHIRVLTR